MIPSRTAWEGIFVWGGCVGNVGLPIESLYWVHELRSDVFSAGRNSVWNQGLPRRCGGCAYPNRNRSWLSRVSLRLFSHVGGLAFYKPCSYCDNSRVHFRFQCDCRPELNNQTALRPKVGLLCLLLPMCILMCSIGNAQRNRGPRRGHTLKLASSSQVFADGSRLELIAVTDGKLENARKPDGTPIVVSMAPFTSSDLAGLKGKQILMRLTLPKARRSANYFPIVETAAGPAIIRSHAENKNVFECLGGLHILPGDRRTEFQVRVATEEFKTVESGVFTNLKRLRGFAFGEQLEPYTAPMPAAKHDPSKKPDFKSVKFDSLFKVEYIVPRRFARDDIWFAAKDARGRPFESAGVYPEERRVAFKGDAAKVAKVELLVRPITRVRFGNIVLNP